MSTITNKMFSKMPANVGQIILALLKQLPTTPIWKISMPSCIHTDLSGLQALALLIFHNKLVLDTYNTIDKIENGLDRLAAIIYCLVDPSTTFFNDKPFNPILGEYLHLKHENYEIKVEQVSHVL